MIYFFADLVTGTNADIFDAWVTNKIQKIQAVASKIKFLLNIDVNECPETIEAEINRTSKYFCLTVKNKWKQCARMRSTFLKKNEVWLKQRFTFPENIKLFITKNKNSTPKTSRGRPQKKFEDGTTQTKKRRIKDLLKNWSPAELNFAAKISANKTAPSTSHKKCLSVQQALALYLYLYFSENKYIILSRTINLLYPGLFPSPTNISINELSSGQ